MGHESRTLLDGHYKSPDGNYERPRYRCVSLETGKTLHRFTPTLRRRRHIGPEAHTDCVTCERKLGRNDGQITARRFGYAVKDIADMLVRAGRGEFYRHIAESVRIQLGRVTPGIKPESASPVIHAIDGFASLVMNHKAPAMWPQIVTIDALPLRSRYGRKRGPKPLGLPYSARQQKLQQRRQRRREKTAGRIIEIGRVLVASGHNFGEPERPLLFRFATGGDEGAYIDFLSQLPGQPEWVVTDRDRGLDNAIDEVWPQAIHYYSHWHLAENAKAALKEDKGLKKRVRDELEREIEWAFVSLKSYNRAFDAATQAGAKNLEDWFRVGRALHRRQLRNQIGHIGYPKGTGAVEGDHIQAVKRAINTRRQCFTNVDRLNKLLALVRAEADHVASVDTYARLIREWLLQREGRVEFPWREAMDSWEVRSLDVEIAEAVRRRKATQAARQAPGKAANRRQQYAKYDAQRLALGLAPRPHGLPRQVKAKGSVAGKKVTDFAWLLYQWHPTRNAGLGPATIPAGSGMKIWWTCDRGPDHEWESQVRSRTMRGVRCPFCMHRLIAPSESFGTTHPDIAVEWHPTRNRDKTPGHFTFGSHFEAWWQCPVYKTHVYQARISSRTSMLSGCRRCAHMKRRKKVRPRLAATAA